MTQSRNPFRGPRPFRIGDEETFFGRSLERELLLRQVLSSRIVVVHAPTGTGKSSLVNASLIPALQRRGFRTPTDEPFRPSQLARSAFESDVLGDALADPDTLASSQPTLILVDQLEEIFTAPHFTFHHEDRFFASLGELSYREDLWMVLVVREDYLAKTLAHAYRFDGGLRSRFAVPLLTVAAAEEIIRETLASAGETLDSKRLRELSSTVARASRDWVGDDLEAIDRLPMIEPLILQLLCQSWVDLAGDTSLDRFPVPRDLVDLSLVGYVDRVLRETAEGVAEDTGPDRAEAVDGLEDRLREWCEDRLTEGAARTQAILPHPGGSLVRGLESLLDGGFLARRRGGRVELTHDRFVHALVESNTAWYRRQKGLLISQRRKWIRGGRLDGDLLRLHEVILHWGDVQRSRASNQEFVDASMQEFRKRAWLLAAFVALVVLLPLPFYFAAVAARHSAEEAQKIAETAKTEQEDYAARASREIEDARLKSLAMSLSQKASVLGDAGSADELALTMALRGFERARDEKIERGSHAKALARSVLLQRVSDPVFVRHRSTALPEVSSFRLQFDDEGHLWLCTEESNGTPATHWLGNPFGESVDTAPRPPIIECDRDSQDELVFADLDLRFGARSRHAEPGTFARGFAFADVGFARDETTSRRRVALGEDGIARLKSLAGIRYPTLQATERIPVRYLRRVERPGEGQDYFLGLSVTPQGAGYLWRVDTESALACRDETAGWPEPRPRCQVGQLIEATWLTRGEPAAAWISADGTVARVASILGEVAQIEIQPSAPELRPVGRSSYPMHDLLVVGDSILAADQIRVFRFDREAPESPQSQAVSFFGAGSAPFYPRLLAQAGEDRVIAIGRDGRLSQTAQPWSRPAFRSGRKLWTDGSFADHIVDLRPTAGPSFLTIRDASDGQRLQYLGWKAGKLQVLGKGWSGDSLLEILGLPRGFEIRAADAVDSLLALAVADSRDLRGSIVLCALRAKGEVAELSDCRGTPLPDYDEVDVNLADTGVTGLSFSPPFLAAPAPDTSPVLHTFLAASTVAGEVHVFSLQLASTPDQVSPLQHVARLKSHVREAVGVDWAILEDAPDLRRRRTQLLASVGRDGVVSVTDFPTGRVGADDRSSIEPLDRILAPVTIYRHPFPLTMLHFDGERLFVGGEDGALRLFDLRSQHLIDRACSLLFGADWRATAPSNLRAENTLCQDAAPIGSQ